MIRLLCAFALIYAVDTHADPYLIAGFGQSRLNTVSVDDQWTQTGFGHKEEERSNAWKLGVGLKFSKYLSAELDYRDLGQFNQQALYVSDMGAPGSYDTKTRACRGSCEPTSSAWQHGTTKGIGLSAVVSPGWEIEPFLRGGLFYHMSKFYSSQQWGNTPYQKQLEVFHSNAESQLNESFDHNGLGLMYGIGIRAKMFELEYTYYPNASGSLSPYKDASSVMLSVRLEFK